MCVQYGVRPQQHTRVHTSAHTFSLSKVDENFVITLLGVFNHKYFRAGIVSSVIVVFVVCFFLISLTNFRLAEWMLLRSMYALGGQRGCAGEVVPQFSISFFVDSNQFSSFIRLFVSFCPWAHHRLAAPGRMSLFLPISPRLVLSTSHSNWVFTPSDLFESSLPISPSMPSCPSDDSICIFAYNIRDRTH